ncbi:Hypoxanthine-guanine phosphoribosyltransferase [Planctomycetales bacterium 10988]|nr:Hypoxanthine-guanine phosphoribosyltransferase [Planctomycetales bacterium 10988]
MKKLLQPEQIDQGVRQLAADLSEHYGKEPILVLAVMVGSVIFLADLIRHLSMPLQVGLLQASSYRGKSTTRQDLEVELSQLPPIEGQHVLILDDIFDTGHTLTRVVQEIEARKPRSFQTAVLLRKRERCEVTMQPDHVIFDIPDAFVVGYGLDYDDQYRNLPFVAALDEQELGPGISS